MIRITQSLLLTFIAVVAAGCAQTSFPQLPASLVNRTDALAKQYVTAIAAHDRQQLVVLGRTPEQADADIAEAPKLASPANPRYLLDMLVADAYARQYAVMLAAGGEVQIRCWFSDSDGPQIRNYQVLSGRQ